jgi:hypothetical protein
MMKRIAAVAVLGTACTVGGGSRPPADDGGVPFEPAPAASYVPKVKNLLTGLPATDAEVAAVVADPGALKGLIDRWMAEPTFETRIEDFFRNAFQQNGVTLTDLSVNLGIPVTRFTANPAYTARIERSLMDSFPRTVWQLIQEGRPFTEALTTPRFMLTTAQLTMLEYADERAVADSGAAVDRLARRAALPRYTLDPRSTATLAQTLDPASPSYLTWADPIAIPATCTTVTPATFAPPTANDYHNLLTFLFGNSSYAPCYPDLVARNHAPILSDADFADWRMVTIHPIAATAATSPGFWNVLANRAATEVNLHVPRVGFASTLAFAANWATNASNEARVTANQALIVAIGQSILGETVTAPFPVNAVDADHAANPACAGCHRQLDPLKQYFRQSWTLSYHDQQDATVIAQPAGFNIGISATGAGIGDLMATLASHPRFGVAWVQKLQFWATSTPAAEDDPEVQRIAQAFHDASWDFKTLVRETFASPLVTLAARTQTTSTNGVKLSIVRRDQFCATLSARLGLPDVCGAVTPAPTAAQQAIAGAALLMPVDTYYRAFALPPLSTDPDLFFRSSTEAICRLVADQVVDAGPASRYLSAAPAKAITDLVTTVMALPPADPRAASATQILTEHLAAATASPGATATAALKSTFITACLAPSSVLVGM